MVGATSSSNGSVGYVNAVPPKDGYNTKYLRADGTWQVPPDHTYNVYNKTLTIQKNGANVATFTSNSNTDVTCNITVPTKTSDLTNDSGFLTSHQDLSGYIPLSGTNALSGSIVPDTDNAYNLGSSSYTYKTIYTHSLNLAMSNAIVRNVNNEELNLYGGVDYFGGAVLQLKGKDVGSYNGCFIIRAYDGSVETSLIGDPRGYLTWGSKNVAMKEDVVPRSGGAVLTSNRLGRVDVNGELSLCGGMDLDYGSSVCVFGKSYPNFGLPGAIRLITNDGSNIRNMYMYPSGTWLWEGQAVQLTSDQRLKQQIAEIDDDLLTAWEDVEPVQFKYNDAVKEKSDNARLHTGYVVQQIDEACKKHNVDVSKYGLYCHEEYPEETREVENEDGTKTTEVVRPASEHYSLRYTETLVVECAYLRRENKRLNDRLTALEELFKKYITK